MQRTPEDAIDRPPLFYFPMPTREEIIKGLKYFSRLNDPAIDFDKVEIDSLVRLDHARDIAGVPFTVTSNYRTPDNPAGFATDAHREIPCSAYDLSCKRPDGSWDSQAAFKIVGALFQAGFKRIGVGKGHIHTDSSKTLPPGVLWLE